MGDDSIATDENKDATEMQKGKTKKTTTKPDHINVLHLGRARTD